MLYAIAVVLLVLLFFTILFIGSQSTKRDTSISLNKLDEAPDSTDHH